MAVDQAIADAKGRLGAAHRFKAEDPKALIAARQELNGAIMLRDIRNALAKGVSPECRREAKKLLSARPAE